MCSVQLHFTGATVWVDAGTAEVVEGTSAAGVMVAVLTTVCGPVPGH